MTNVPDSSHYKATSPPHWKLIRFEETKDSNTENVADSLTHTLQSLGKTISNSVVDGGFGAYVVDDNNYNYYVVKWDGLPYEAVEDEGILFGDDQVAVFKGDMLCRGIWMDKLRGARSWWIMTERSCVVRLQQVLDAHLPLKILSDENPLRSRLRHDAIDYANTHSAWRIPDDDHAFMIEETRWREGFDYEEFVAEDDDVQPPNGSDVGDESDESSSNGESGEGIM